MSKRMMVMFVAMAVFVLQPVLGPVLRAQAREGITVHGHWAIDIRQPDGTLVSHTEFENALQRAGQLFLADLLSRQSIAGSWMVVLQSQGGGAPCTEAGGQSCTIGEPGIPVAAGASSSNLTVSDANGSVVLTGSMTAQRAGSILAVKSTQLGCQATITPATCASNPGFQVDFSGTGLPGPKVVTAGQIIQVTVTFTFS